jgi:hypothetical protein
MKSLLICYLKNYRSIRFWINSKCIFFGSMFWIRITIFITSTYYISISFFICYSILIYNYNYTFMSCEISTICWKCTIYSSIYCIIYKCRIFFTTRISRTLLISCTYSFIRFKFFPSSIILFYKYIFII